MAVNTLVPGGANVIVASLYPIRTSAPFLVSVLHIRYICSCEQACRVRLLQELQDLGRWSTNGKQTINGAFNWSHPRSSTMSGKL